MTHQCTNINECAASHNCKICLCAHAWEGRFCWGGLYATLLTAGKAPKVAAALVYHGSLITKEDVLAINAPINFQQSDPELDNQIKTDFYKEVSTSLLAYISPAGFYALSSVGVVFVITDLQLGRSESCFAALTCPSNCNSLGCCDGAQEITARQSLRVVIEEGIA